MTRDADGYRDPLLALVDDPPATAPLEAGRRTGENERPHQAEAALLDGSMSAGSGEDLRSRLETLSPLIVAAMDYASRWDARYAAEVFRVALNRLLGGTNEPNVLPRVQAAAAERKGGESAASGGPAHRLSLATGIDVDVINRFVQFDDAGKLDLLVRLDGSGKKELQVKYSLLYLYVKEVAFGEQMVSVEELRALCIRHACYDAANFTSNYARGVTAGLLRQQGDKGSRERRFLLSKKGLDEAVALFRKVASE